MPPSLRFDQGDTGTVDRSRSDITISVAVDVFAIGIVGTATFAVLDKPPGSAAAFSGANPGDRTITPDVIGSYRIRITDSDDGSTVIHTFTVRTTNRSLAIPAHNERANADANEVDPDVGGTWVDDSETNEGGSNKGWALFLRELYLAVDDSPTVAHTHTRVVQTYTSGPVTVSPSVDVYLIDATAGAITVNLPTAVGVSGAGYTIVKTDATGFAVTIDPNGSETLSGSATKILTSFASAVPIISDNANWWIL